MTVNAFYDFQFNQFTGDIDHIYYCTNEGKREVILSHLFERFDFLDTAPFTLNNLCKHYPNRVLIYAEQYSPYCEREWWNYANYSLMSAYSRITKVYESHYGYRPQAPIRYDEPKYIDTIYKETLANGLELLWFPADIYDQIHVGEGSTLESKPDYLLFYPILFKKSENGEHYFAYNPQLGLTDKDFHSSHTDIGNFLYNLTSYNIHSNPICDSTGLHLRFPLYPVYVLDTFRNIDLAKLNIGFSLNSIQGVNNG